MDLTSQRLASQKPKAKVAPASVALSHHDSVIPVTFGIVRPAAMPTEKIPE
jgi:hypothetical protein